MLAVTHRQAQAPPQRPSATINPGQDSWNSTGLHSACVDQWVWELLNSSRSVSTRSIWPAQSKQQALTKNCHFHLSRVSHSGYASAQNNNSAARKWGGGKAWSWRTAGSERFWSYSSWALPPNTGLIIRWTCPWNKVCTSWIHWWLAWDGENMAVCFPSVRRPDHWLTLTR